VLREQINCPNRGNHPSETLGCFPDLPRIEPAQLSLHVLTGSHDMIMVFFSSDRLEIERVSQELTGAAIPCEVRDGVAVKGKVAHLPEAEVWIQHDGDLHRAFMRCVQRGIGFAKRETDTTDTDSWNTIVAA